MIARTMDEQPSATMTVQEAAIDLKVSARRVRAMLAAGQLAATRPEGGRAWQIERWSVEALAAVPRASGRPADERRTNVLMGSATLDRRNVAITRWCLIRGIPFPRLGDIVVPPLVAMYGCGLVAGGARPGVYRVSATADIIVERDVIRFMLYGAPSTA